MVSELRRGQGQIRSPRDLKELSARHPNRLRLPSVHTLRGDIVLLTAIDTLTGMVMACQLPSKAVSEYAGIELKAFLMDAGRSGDVILQSDQEPAIMTQVKKVAQALPNVKVRQAPVYSSGSQGAVERWHQTLNGQITTFISVLKNKLNIDIDAHSPLLPWIVRHSAWVISRFMVHSSDKLTSYTRRWDQPYTSPIGSCGEAVNFKISASHTPKLAASG